MDKAFSYFSIDAIVDRLAMITYVVEVPKVE